MDKFFLKKLTERLPKPFGTMLSIIIILVFFGGLCLAIMAIIGLPFLVYLLVKKIIGLELEKSVDGLALVLSLIIGYVTVRIITDRRTKKKCASCQKNTVEFLTLWIDGKKRENTPYCREHLVEAFLRQFKKQRAKAIVLQPQFTKPLLRRGYCQYSRKQLEEYHLIDTLGLNFDERIRRIVGNCAVCGKLGTIHYYADPAYAMNKDVVQNMALPEPPRTLCRDCTAKLLRPDLLANKDGYTEGLQLSEDVESAFFNFT